MVAEPIAIPCTGTVTLVAFAGIVTVAGTVAAEVLLELRLTVRAADGAGLMSSVMLAVVVGAIVIVDGAKLADVMRESSGRTVCQPGTAVFCSQFQPRRVAPCAPP